jgi:hypothetical protein
MQKSFPVASNGSESGRDGKEVGKMGEEGKKAWEEPEEAFKLFVTAYNARQRKDRKARQETAPIEIKQKGRTIENTIHGGVGSINQTKQKVINKIMPEAGTIGANKLLWIEIKDAHRKAAEARGRTKRNGKNSFGMLWKKFGRDYSIGKVKPSEWIKAQPKERAYEFIAWFNQIHAGTKEGRIKEAQRTRPLKTRRECHIRRSELVRELGWTDENFRDFLERMTGFRSTDDLKDVSQYVRILGLMEKEAGYRGQ